MSGILTSKDISKKLKIGKPRVREISKLLEKEAYQFTKNHDTRMYSENDVKLIKNVIENFNQHQNLPLAVQNALSNYQQTQEVMHEELPLIQQSIEVTVQTETDPYNHNHSIQLEESPSMLDSSVENNVVSNQLKLANDIEPLSHKVDVVEQIEVSFTGVDVVEQFEASSIGVDVVEQIDVFSPGEEVVEQIDVFSPGEDVVEQIVSVSSNIQEVVSQKSTNSLNEPELLDRQADSHKLVEFDEESNSNQMMFEEFMSQISNLATQNEMILQQNQTLIQQNVLKDQKLEKILHSVEEKSDELQELASVIEEKDEKLEQMFEEIQVREIGRDAQLMRVIREMQETKKMVAASKEKDWKSSLKSFFIKPKAVK